MDDFNVIMESGIWNYLKELKETGKVRKMGFCSHSLEISKAFINTGLVDCFMLSVNPIYDFVKKRWSTFNIQRKNGLLQRM